MRERENNMDFLKDDELGEFTYSYGWVREYTIQLFGDDVNVQLVIPCDEGDDIEEAQRAAFLAFDANKDAFATQAECAIFDHYLTVCGGCRARFGVEFADKLAPLISEMTQIKGLVKATQVVVQQTFGTGDRVVGLIFICSWEPELGLAVRFVNEHIDEVGPQDIFL